MRLAAVLAVLLVGCSTAAPAAAPTLVTREPTAVATATPPVEPTPTEAPPPTSSSSPSRSPSPSPIELAAPASARPITPIAAIAVPGAENLHVTDDAIWVFVVNEGRTSFARIDPETMQKTKTITPEIAGVGAIGYGSLWVAEFDAGAVFRYDLETGDQIASIPTGPGAHEVFIAGGSVWVPNHHGGSVSRVDPSTNEAATIGVGAPGMGGPSNLASAGGRIWVTEPLARQLTGIDTATNEVDAELDLDFEPCAVSAVDGRLWVVECSAYRPLLQIVDAESRPSALVRTPEGAGWPTLVGDHVWVVMGTRFVGLDRSSLEAVDAVALPAAISSPVDAFGSIYAITAGTVVQLDPSAFVNPG